MTMCEQSQPNDSGQMELLGLTSFVAASPVNRFPLPGSSKARTITATSGRKCSGLYRKQSPLGLLVKMLLVSSVWHSARCLLTWKASGTKSNRFIIPACAVNAPHRRDRVWIVAYSKHGGRSEGSETAGRETGAVVDGLCRSGRLEYVADSESIGQREPANQAGALTVGRQAWDEPGNGCEHDTDPNRLWKLQQERLEQDIRGRASNCDKKADGDTNGAGCEEQHITTVANQPGQYSGELVATGPDWTVESPFCGVADGIPRRVDRLKCLGNAVVPQIPEIIGRAIMAVTYPMEGQNPCNSTKK